MVSSTGIALMNGLGLIRHRRPVHHRVHHRGTGINPVVGALINHLIGGSYKITGSGKKRKPGRPRRVGRPNTLK